MKHEESKLQIKCVEEYYNLLHEEEMTLFAIPNGGARNVVTGAILKREGVVAGVADLFLMKRNKTYAGLFIEMKTAKGVQSESQKKFQRVAENNGYKYVICRNEFEFINIVKKYLEDN